MSDFFSVQMNMADRPNVQVEQSTSKSIETSSETSENSFNSVLQSALPKDNNNNNTPSNGKNLPQEAAPESTNENAPVEKTSPAIDQSLLLTSDDDLKANVRQLLAFLTENTNHEEKQTTLANVQSSPETIETAVPGQQTSQDTKGISLLNVQANPNTNETVVSGEQTSRDTNGLVVPNVQASPETIETAVPGQQTSRDTNGLALPNVQTRPDTNQVTIPGEQFSTGSDENKIIDLLNTYFTSDSAKDIHQTLKDIRTALAQENLFLSSPSTPSKQDALSFGGLTKNIGELQNLLAGKSGTELPITPSNPVSLTSQQQAFLERIQSIIANGQEAGTLSIKNIQPEQGASLRIRLDHFSSQIQTIEVNTNREQTSPLINGDGFTALQEGVFAPTLRNRQQQLSGVRHDSNQQYYDAKTQVQNVMTESTNLSDNQKGDGMNQPGSGFNQMSPLNASPETNNTFSMTNNTSLNALTGQVTDPTKATMLPSGMLVQDHEVIQQLVERFQINRRQMDSKIQLRLHPVELGKMEIDLTVKEGSIRANVVAQSQHVQEIVERNIAKLRSVLEQQGFNVEDITVTRSPETAGDADLFNQHLPNRDTSGFLAQNDRSEAHSPFNIDDPEEIDNETNTGLNVEA